MVGGAVSLVLPLLKRQSDTSTVYLQWYLNTFWIVAAKTGAIMRLPLLVFGLNDLPNAMARENFLDFRFMFI
jgi:hypothetical protein